MKRSVFDEVLAGIEELTQLRKKEEAMNNDTPEIKQVIVFTPEGAEYPVLATDVGGVGDGGLLVQLEGGHKNIYNKDFWTKVYIRAVPEDEDAALLAHAVEASKDGFVTAEQIQAVQDQLQKDFGGTVQ